MSDQEIQNDDKSFDVLDEILEWLESFVFAIFVVILIFIFLFRIVLVQGPSMNSTLANGDRLIISHINYTPNNGDIVVLNSRGLNKTIIKRCIGVEGDLVVINYNNNTVTVNGEDVSQDYINEEMLLMPSFDENFKTGENIYTYKVPTNKIFVLGDNRNESTDSRSSYVGFVDTKDVLGKAVFRVMPFKSFGKIG